MRHAALCGPHGKRPPDVRCTPGGQLPSLVITIPLVLLAMLIVATAHGWAALRPRLLALPGPTAVQPASGPAIPMGGTLSSVFTPTVQLWGPNILTWAQEFGLPPDLVATVMQIESCGDPRVRSASGAQGLFQVMPFHFTAAEDATDPQTNARHGLAYLAGSLSIAQGNVALALAGYNGGQSVIGRDPSLWPDETQRYVAWGTAILADAQRGAHSSPALDAWLAAGGRALCRDAEHDLRVGL